MLYFSIISYGEKASLLYKVQNCKTWSISSVLIEFSLYWGWKLRFLLSPFDVGWLRCLFSVKLLRFFFFFPSVSLYYTFRETSFFFFFVWVSNSPVVEFNLRNAKIEDDSEVMVPGERDKCVCF